MPPPKGRNRTHMHLMALWGTRFYIRGTAGTLHVSMLCS